MKRVGIQGFFTRRDLMELIEIFLMKGARYAALTFSPPAVELCDANMLITEFNPLVNVVWLSTTPFEYDPKNIGIYGIDLSAKGAFSISFQRCDPEYGAILETAIGTTCDAHGEQLKVWESGLRVWKKRIVRDVHVFSYVTQKAYANEKVNVSMDAINGYERGDWNLVTPSGQQPASIIHPLIANKELPFSL